MAFYHVADCGCPEGCYDCGSKPDKITFEKWFKQLKKEARLSGTRWLINVKCPDDYKTYYDMDYAPDEVINTELSYCDNDN